MRIWVYDTRLVVDRNRKHADFRAVVERLAAKARTRTRRAQIEDAAQTLLAADAPIAEAALALVLAAYRYDPRTPKQTDPFDQAEMAREKRHEDLMERYGRVWDIVDEDGIDLNSRAVPKQVDTALRKRGIEWSARVIAKYVAFVRMVKKDWEEIETK
jgi:hypothetical protein